MKLKKIDKLFEESYTDVIHNTPSMLVTREMLNQRFAENIISDVMNIIQNVNVQHIVRTTFDKDMMEGLKHSINQAIVDEYLDENN